MFVLLSLIIITRVHNPWDYKLLIMIIIVHIPMEYSKTGGTVAPFLFLCSRADLQLSKRRAKHSRDPQTPSTAEFKSVFDWEGLGSGKGCDPLEYRCHETKFENKGGVVSFPDP